MKATVRRTRMACRGIECAYDVHVDFAELSSDRHRDAITYRVRFADTLEATLEDALLPIEHFDRPTGLERYRAYLAHERRARRFARMLTERAFPEVIAFPDPDRLPLWHPVGKENGTSAKRVVEFDLAEFAAVVVDDDARIARDNRAYCTT